LTVEEAIAFIRPGIINSQGVWADIGAGTGTFTEALFHLLKSGKVIATDKSPHALYSLKSPAHIQFEIVDADFTKPMELPEVDGILMANALHYAKDHKMVLKNVLQYLKRGGTFLLIEYDTDNANPPWVPYPVSLSQFQKLCKDMELNRPEVLGRKRSMYSQGEMYLATVKK
jgi:trans-aconitate methyltransferase